MRKTPRTRLGMLRSPRIVIAASVKEWGLGRRRFLVSEDGGPDRRPCPSRCSPPGSWASPRSRSWVAAGLDRGAGRRRDPGHGRPAGWTEAQKSGAYVPGGTITAGDYRLGVGIRERCSSLGENLKSLAGFDLSLTGFGDLELKDGPRRRAGRCPSIRSRPDQQHQRDKTRPLWRGSSWAN